MTEAQLEPVVIEQPTNVDGLLADFFAKVPEADRARLLPELIRPQTERNEAQIVGSPQREGAFAAAFAGHAGELDVQAVEARLRSTAGEVLRFWGVVDDDKQVKMEFVEGIRDRRGRKQADSWRVNTVNTEGAVIRSYAYEGLLRDHEAKLAGLQSARAEKAQLVNYWCQRQFGKSAEDMGLTIRPANETSEDVVIEGDAADENTGIITRLSERVSGLFQGSGAIIEGESISFAAFKEQVGEAEIGVKKALRNLEQALGSKKEARRAYLRHETGIGKSLDWAFGARAKRLAQLEQRVAQLETLKQSGDARWWQRMQLMGTKVVGKPHKALSAGLAAARGIVGAVGYDYNPLRPVVSKTLGKLWAHDFRRHKSTGREKSMKEWVGRAMEKLMVDPITGEGKRMKVGEREQRAVVVAAVEMAVKMNILPQFLATMPAFQAINMSPGEIWSFYRSMNMVKNTPGSFTPHLKPHVFRLGR